MRAVVFYHEETGELRGGVFSGHEAAIELNTPPHHLALDAPAGMPLDTRTHYVDVASKTIEQREAPADAEATRRAKQTQISARIRRLENSQARAVREIILGTSDIERLKEIDAEIESLRTQLR